MIELDEVDNIWQSFRQLCPTFNMTVTFFDLYHAICTTLLYDSVRCNMYQRIIRLDM